MEEAREVVNRVSCHGMLFTLEDREFSIPSRGTRLTLVIHHKTLDSETLEPVVLRRTRTLLPLEHLSEESLLEQVWYSVKQAYLHEAGEFFRIGGAAIHHPHGKEL